MDARTDAQTNCSASVFRTSGSWVVVVSHRLLSQVIICLRNRWNYCHGRTHRQIHGCLYLLHFCSNVRGYTYDGDIRFAVTRTVSWTSTLLIRVRPRRTNGRTYELLIISLLMIVWTLCYRSVYLKRCNAELLIILVDGNYTCRLDSRTDAWMDLTVCHVEEQKLGNATASNSVVIIFTSVLLRL